MNIWQLSLRYLKRKKVKTAILFVVFLTIGACLISLIGIRNSLEKNIIEPQGRRIYLSADAEGLWPKEVYKAFENAKIVKNIEANTYASLKTNLKLVKNPHVEERKHSSLTVLGYKATSPLSAFRDKQLILVKGKHLTSDKTSQALLPEELAKKNHLKVGDQFKLGKQTFNISGLFAVNPKAKDSFASKNLSNTVLANEDKVSTLSGKVGYQSMVVSLDDSQKVEGILSNIKQWPLRWQHLKVQNAKDYYGESFQNILTLHALVSKLLTIISILSTLLLVLMLTFWINNRIKETGILLSIGMSKGQVILHYFLEVLVVVMLSFIFSIFLGNLMGQGLANQLLSQVNGGIIAQTVQDMNLMTEKIDLISIRVGFGDIVRLYLLGTLISFLAVALSSYSIARLHPKQILSKMS